MKPDHAAALALERYYLMVPPLKSNSFLPESALLYRCVYTGPLILRLNAVVISC